MENYLNVIQSLLLQSWYLPSVIIITIIIHYYLKSANKQKNLTTPVKTTVWWLVGIGFLIFLMLSIPYWIFGDNAAHGYSDDIAHILQTYLSSSLRGDSINWTNGLAGGMDRWLLPNCYPHSFGRIYALFLHKPYQLSLFVMVINVIFVFVYSFKIQTELWQMRPWAAYIGAVIATIIEGYWTGVYPDAHVSNGHGFTVIIVGIYYLTRFAEHSKFWLVAVAIGALMAMSSWTPFHNLPPLLITVGLWGLVFWGRGAWFKIIKANAIIIFIFILLLLPYFLAIKLLFSTSGRITVFRPSVELAKFYLVPQMIILICMGIVGASLKIYRQKIVRKVFILFLAFSLLPLIAYGLELSKIAPFFRWNLLFAGNDAWGWFAIIFFIERIQKEIEDRWPFAGLASKILIISIGWIVIIFAWMGSFWIDLTSSYPEGNWSSYTDTSVSSLMKKIEPNPVRVVGIDETHDMHFWGEYQGIEPFLVYTPFIDRRKTFFWWYSAMLPSLHGAYTAAWLSIPVPVPGHEHNYNFPIPLPVLVNLDALRVANVHWIVSHHPLYPMEDLEMIVAKQGQATCSPTSGSPSQVDFKYLHHFWDDVGCIVKDYGYQRPLYVYHLKRSLPRVYLASQIYPWTPGNEIPVLSQEELKVAAKGAAFIDLNEWILHPTQASLGRVDIDNYQSDYIHMKLNIQQNALVVIATTLNKYWRVLVDGHRVNNFDVNGFQSGFWIEPGETQAELIYCPPLRPHQTKECSQ